jgi:hypothetical protein
MGMHQCCQNFFIKFIIVQVLYGLGTALIFSHVNTILA